jgi:negative regulator of flagellin synthesis FlgM
MQVYGPTHVHGPQAIGAPHAVKPAQSPTSAGAASIGDEVQISDAAKLIEKMQQIPDVRQDRVASIRAQIAQGAYETPQRLDAAVSRLLDEIG